MMKLHKALKDKKKLVGEISRLKSRIGSKNCYSEGTVDPEKFDVKILYEELLRKTDELVKLKLVINDCNRAIQEKIYCLSEYKGLISWWSEVCTLEGEHLTGSYGDKILRKYRSQIDEVSKEKIIHDLQEKVDLIQEELDTFNYTTDLIM
jgi:hypothetical protein